MKKTVIALLALLATAYAHAQTKVFKEVSDGISSQIRSIQQDGVLMGYLVFTQLEKASADSFNYKITIMDENLNDIGTINFREQKLFLKAVTLEQDVLCVAYLKSNIIGNDFKNRKEYRNALPDDNTCVFTQFLGLDGKIIKTNSTRVNLALSQEPTYIAGSKVQGAGKLKQDVQLKNIPGKGFACFYGDDTKNVLLVFNTAGIQTWQKIIVEKADGYVMLPSGKDIYILMKKFNNRIPEGGFELLGFNTADSSTLAKLVLQDKQGNPLKVLGFDNDPVTGKPYITGNIINPRRPNSYEKVNMICRGPYTGVFTINVNGHEKKAINEIYTYWGDGSQTLISKKGRFQETRTFTQFRESFRDYQGNTLFAGSFIKRKPRIGTIVASVVTLPLILPPAVIAALGFKKYVVKDVVLLKQTPKGLISVDQVIPTATGYKLPPWAPFSMFDSNSFYTVTNSDTKSDYFIVSDAKNTLIYNIDQKKMVRTIPHKDGNVSTYVYPAKEGHIMVSEFNKKERSTRYSIESL